MKLLVDLSNLFALYYKIVFFMHRFMLIHNPQTGFKTHSSRENDFWNRKLSQLLRNGVLIDIREESTITTLLNQHKQQLHSKNLSLYLQTIVTNCNSHLSPRKLLFATDIDQCVKSYPIKTRAQRLYKQKHLQTSLHLRLPEFLKRWGAMHVRTGGLRNLL